MSRWDGDALERRVFNILKLFDVVGVGVVRPQNQKYETEKENAFASQIDSSRSNRIGIEKHISEIWKVTINDDIHFPCEGLH